MGAKLDVILEQIKEIKPQTYIEIGCYRCDTMHEVKKLGVPRLIGFDLFEQADSHEEAPLDGLPITYEEALKFGYELYKGNTWETLNVLSGLELESPIVVFIDGGHSFETTLNDSSRKSRRLLLSIPPIKTNTCLFLRLCCLMNSFFIF